MSRKTRFSNRRCFLAGLMAMLAIALVTGPVATARAKPLDGPRAAGQIGERYDGYVVLRDQNAPASVKALVSQTNAQRKALYEKRAKEDKVPVSAIGKIYAEQIIKSAPKGTYFLDASGKWTRR
jgi:uncharacterized protein YdbL (DUF1318 family)